MRSAAGARAIVIGEEDSRLNANASDVITIPPSNPLFAPILTVIPLSAFVLHGGWKGLRPDFPRNLSKTLTVD